MSDPDTQPSVPQPPPTTSAAPAHAAPREVPGWFPVAGFACVAVFILFLMAIILFNVQVGGNRMLVVFLLAIVLAVGGVFIGGDQAAKGTLPFPFAKNNPIEFSLAGGGALFLVALTVGYWTYGRVPEVDSAAAECQSLYRRGSEYLAGGHLSDAVTAFSDVIVKCPSDAEGWRGRSRAYTRMNQNDDAFGDAQKALSLKPQDLALKFNVARLYLVLKNESMAIEKFDELLRETPADVNAHYNIGLAYQRTGKFEEAKRHYEEVIQRNGELAESAAFNLAAAYAEKSKDCGSGEARQALDLLRKSLDLAAKEGKTDLRVRMISGKQATENSEKLEGVRPCPAFGALLAEAAKPTV